MTASRSPATPDPMVALCLMGGAVRAAGELNVLLQLMFIATCSPALSHAFLAWLATEERYAHLRFADEPGVVTDGPDGRDGYVPARNTTRGRIALWRHVTRSGHAVMVPVVLAEPFRAPNPRSPQLGWLRTWQFTPPLFLRVFSPVLALSESYGLIVPLSQ